MEIGRYIDHSLLKADVRKEDLEKLCAEAAAHNFAAVCIPPYFISAAAQYLEGKPVKISTVIGFPMGFESTTAKVEEIKRAIDMGVDELDVVVNIGAVKNGEWTFVNNDIETVTRAAHMKGKTVKIILETSLLEDSEIDELCKICTTNEVDFVKTSTGHNGGATIEMIRKLRSLLPETIKIKASGGIKNNDQARALIEAGADRLGTSSSMAIINSVSNVG